MTPTSPTTTTGWHDSRASDRGPWAVAIPSVEGDEDATFSALLASLDARG